MQAGADDDGDAVEYGDCNAILVLLRVLLSACMITMSYVLRATSYVVCVTTYGTHTLGLYLVIRIYHRQLEPIEHSSP